MSLVLLVFLGLIKIMFVGYEQAQADGAAFVAAHAASLPDTLHNPASRGASRVTTDFPNFPSSGTEGVKFTIGANDVAAVATRVAGGLFLGTGIAGAPASINLTSETIEPLGAAPFGSVPVVTASLLDSAGNTVGIPNCLTGPASSKTTNQATAAGTPWGCAYVPPQFDAGNPNNHFDGYECRLAYYASLDRTTIQLNDLNSPPYNYDPSQLKDGGGHTLTQHNWPTEYQTASGGSINDPNVRGSGVFLTTQNPQQNIGGGATGGLAGTQLIPILMMGIPDTGGYTNPCP
jgi:hypothetical protein